MLHALLREIDALEADMAKAAKRPLGVAYEQPPGSGRWYEVRPVGDRRKRVRVPAPHREVEDWDPAPRTRAERAADDPDATVIRPRRQVGGMSDAWDAAGRPGDPDWDGPDGDTHFDIKTTWHRPLSRQQKWHDYVVDVVDAMEDHLRSHLPRRVQRWLERFDERPMSKGLRRALWDLAVLEAELEDLAKGRYVYRNADEVGEKAGWDPPSGRRTTWRWDTQKGPAPKAKRGRKGDGEPKPNGKGRGSKKASATTYETTDLDQPVADRDERDFAVEARDVMKRLREDLPVAWSLMGGDPDAHHDEVQRLLRATHDNAEKLGWSREKVHKAIAEHYGVEAMGSRISAARARELKEAHKGGTAGAFRELAKGRQHHGEGEEWTRPSGQRVRKVGGKVVNVPKDGGHRRGPEGSDASALAEEILSEAVYDRVMEDDEDQEWRFVFGEMDPRERRWAKELLAGGPDAPGYMRQAAAGFLRELTAAGVAMTVKPPKRPKLRKG